MIVTCLFSALQSQSTTAKSDCHQHWHAILGSHFSGCVIPWTCSARAAAPRTSQRAPAPNPSASMIVRTYRMRYFVHLNMRSNSRRSLWWPSNRTPVHVRSQNNLAKCKMHWACPLFREQHMSSVRVLRSELPWARRASAASQRLLPASRTRSAHSGRQNPAQLICFKACKSRQMSYQKPSTQIAHFFQNCCSRLCSMRARHFLTFPSPMSVALLAGPNRAVVLSALVRLASNSSQVTWVPRMPVDALRMLIVGAGLNCVASSAFIFQTKVVTIKRNGAYWAECALWKGIDV